MDRRPSVCTYEVHYIVTFLFVRFDFSHFSIGHSAHRMRVSVCARSLAWDADGIIITIFRWCECFSLAIFTSSSPAISLSLYLSSSFRCKCARKLDIYCVRYFVLAPLSSPHTLRLKVWSCFMWKWKMKKKNNYGHFGTHRHRRFWTHRPIPAIPNSRWVVVNKLTVRFVCVADF